MPLFYSFIQLKGKHFRRKLPVHLIFPSYFILYSTINNQRHNIVQLIYKQILNELCSYSIDSRHEYRTALVNRHKQTLTHKSTRRTTPKKSNNKKCRYLCNLTLHTAVASRKKKGVFKYPSRSLLTNSSSI